jgi:murein DD-endopeptidase MepM/ murein hydrolase activator NlpD
MPRGALPDDVIRGGYKSIDGTLSRRRQNRGRLTLKPNSQLLEERTNPSDSARRPRLYLDGAVIIIALLVAVATIVGHGAREASGQTARLPLTVAEASAQLPLLSPAVESVASPKTEPVRAAAAAQAAVADPRVELTQTAASASSVPSTTSGATPTARLGRAQALPELPLAAGPTVNQTAGSSSPSTGAPTIANTLDSQYVEHTIVSGESLSSIATSYGITINTIEINNPGLDDFDVIHPGQTLRIPTTKGLLYHVQSGDTLDGISRRYGVPLQDVVSLPANKLQDADMITPGQTILLPGDIAPPPPPVVAALPAAPQVILQPPSQPDQTAASAPPSAATAAAPAVVAATPAVPITRFIWPIQGPITQGFGVPELGVGAPHTGIDIGLYGRDGAPIAAAAGGTITFSGGDACCSYGYYVIVKHAGGFSTLYGHLSKRAVSIGDTVTQGQIIGYAGSTGFSTGTHLHFEIQVNGSPQNPLKYLP